MSKTSIDGVRAVRTFVRGQVRRTEVCYFCGGVGPLEATPYRDIDGTPWYPGGDPPAPQVVRACPRCRGIEPHRG